ncbi:MAG: hypothetical protein Q4G10_08600 [Bacteroidia bacterium]|nr:hypothetical protein [Bacteroidia bacterium]
MAKINGNVQEQMCPDYTITISKQMADILRARQDDRVSRFDAFRHLVELCALNQASGGSDSDAASATVRISALADAWHWHRHTAKTFLDELVETGALTYEKTPTGVSLHLNCLTLPTGE